MKDVRPFEGIITRQVSDELSDQTHFSILNGNAGLKEASNKQRCGSYYVILLQEAESHFHEVREFATEQFHIYQGADQIIQFHMSTFGPGGEDRRSDPGHVKATLLWLEVLEGLVYAHEDAQAETNCVHTCLRSPEQHDREEARNRKTAPGPAEGNH